MKRKDNLVHPVKSFDVASMQELEAALRRAFDVETCYPNERKDWTRDLPTYGQCAVAALVVQDYLGGEIVYDQENIHFWNRIEGVDIDFTRDQFDDSVVLQETRIRSRQELLVGPRAEAAETLHRYQLLRERVRRRIPPQRLAVPPMPADSVFSSHQGASQKNRDHS